VEAATAFMRKNPEEALKIYLAACLRLIPVLKPIAFHLTLPFYAAPGGSNAEAWQRFA